MRGVRRSDQITSDLSWHEDEHERRSHEWFESCLLEGRLRSSEEGWKLPVTQRSLL